MTNEKVDKSAEAWGNHLSPAVKKLVMSIMHADFCRCILKNLYGPAYMQNLHYSELSQTSFRCDCCRLHYAGPFIQRKAVHFTICGIFIEGSGVPHNALTTKGALYSSYIYPFAYRLHYYLSQICPENTNSHKMYFYIDPCTEKTFYLDMHCCETALDWRIKWS